MRDEYLLLLATRLDRDTAWTFAPGTTVQMLRAQQGAVDALLVQFGFEDARSSTWGDDDDTMSVFLEQLQRQLRPSAVHAAAIARWIVEMERGAVTGTAKRRRRRRRVARYHPFPIDRRAVDPYAPLLS
jgi:hypothetical protein